MTGVEERLHNALLRLNRALDDVRNLRREGLLEQDAVPIALSRVAIMTNTIASIIASVRVAPEDEALVKGCADLLWRFGEGMATMDNYWLKLASDDARP